MRPRPALPVRLFARLAVGVLVPLLGVTWLVGTSAVTLQVDGEPRPVVTHARTVGELLDRANIAYTDADEVVPPPDTEIRDGMVIEVVHAREITLLVGGQEQQVLVTALNVDEVVRQFARRSDITSRSIVRPSRLLPVQSGMTVSVVNPVSVVVEADGATTDLVTDATDVAGVLQRLDITLSRKDRVRPSLETPVTQGLRIVVERVRTRRVMNEVQIPFTTEERPTNELPRGERREVQAGRNGVAEIVERVTIVDGEPASRKKIKRTVLIRPQPRVVAVGTAEPQSDSANEPQSGQRPERPEQQSDPEPDPEPEPAGDSRTDTGQASYYHHPEEGLTAAHRTLPFGTVVTVTNRANGKSVNVTINDRGPFIEGRIIDLNEEAFTQIASKSTGVINVRIAW